MNTPIKRQWPHVQRALKPDSFCKESFSGQFIVRVSVDFAEAQSRSSEMPGRLPMKGRPATGWEVG
jgi:hypothetical protein